MTELLIDPKLSPMMEQYRSIRKALSRDTVLFFRLGDFYEMFFDDAVRSAEILNITLTGREGGEAGRVPMCGIPYHAFRDYVRVLLDHQLKVAVCEQIGDPKASKGLVERKITRIITPATYLDEENKSNAAEYMAAVSGDKKQSAIAYLDLGTGEFFVREMETARLSSELTLLSPREVILPQSLSEDPELMSFVRESLGAVVTTYEDWIFESREGMRLMTENFRLASETGLLFHHRPLAVSAAGAVLYYLKDHLHEGLGHLKLPVYLDASDFMVLDRQTQRSLELVQSMSGKKNGPTLLNAIDQTLTSMGGRTLYQWVTHPLLSLDQIRERQEAVKELASDLGFVQSVRGLLGGVKDMERTLSRLNYGVANARDLVNLKIFLARVPQFQGLLVNRKSAGIQKIAVALNPFPEIRQLIEKGIADSPPLSVREGGMISDGFRKDLDELREISKNGKNWILDFQKREIERTGIKSLRVKYSQVFGYTLEISKSNLNAVPSDYIRRQTLANAERFIVPELKLWDEKINGAEDKIKALEYEVFNEIRARILEDLAGLQAMAKAVGILDALASLAITAVQRKWVCPEITSSHELHVRGGRHPVVEMMLASGQFVENDTFLDTGDNQLIILTGPNMAGKSTYIRQVALLTLLAQIGSYVPAQSARIGLVDRIFTRIGASDNLAQGESTFMVEMIETAQILHSATEKSLLILDEVGRGTSTFDGVSIAWAICEYLAKGSRRPRTLFATHYHELTQLEDQFPGVINFNITVRETKDGIIFLRKVVKGGSDRSYGIHVARLAGIPKEVTERAETILKVLESESVEATQIIEGKKPALRTKKTSAQPTLFEIVNPRHPVLDDIETVLPDHLTPMEALHKISEWKKKIKESK